MRLKIPEKEKRKEKEGASPNSSYELCSNLWLTPQICMSTADSKKLNYGLKKSSSCLYQERQSLLWEFRYVNCMLKQTKKQNIDTLQSNKQNLEFLSTTQAKYTQHVKKQENMIQLNTRAISGDNLRFQEGGIRGQGHNVCQSNPSENYSIRGGK